MIGIGLNMKGEAMQEQDLKEYWRTIITLKNGRQIEILTEKKLHFVHGLYLWRIKGFIVTPMLLEKEVEIVQDNITAIESTLEPHPTWRNTELDPHNCDHSKEYCEHHKNKEGCNIRPTDNKHLIG